MHHLHRTMMLALFLLGLVFGGPAQGEDLPTLKAAAAKTGVLTHMTAATRLAGLDRDDIKLTLTLFAPTDCAFNALDPEVRAKLLAPANVGLLTRVLMHHAVVGEYPTERLLRAKAKNYTVAAVDESELEFNVGTRGVDVDEGRIVRGDIRAQNGIIHLIDRVLIPVDVMADLMSTPAPADKVTEGPSQPGGGCCEVAAGETGSIERH